MGYPFGTKRQHKNGRIEIKDQALGGKSGWLGYGRYIYLTKIDGRVTEHDRVFHRNGDKADDSQGNLVAIRFNGTRYSFSKTRILYMPKI